MSELQYTECEQCGEPINGRKCRVCGFRQARDRIVECTSCGQETAASGALTIRETAKTIHLCGGCRP